MLWFGILFGFIVVINIIGDIRNSFNMMLYDTPEPGVKGISVAYCFTAAVGFGVFVIFGTTVEAQKKLSKLNIFGYPSHIEGTNSLRDNQGFDDDSEYDNNSEIQIQNHIPEQQNQYNQYNQYNDGLAHANERHHHKEHDDEDQRNYHYKENDYEIYRNYNKGYNYGNQMNHSIENQIKFNKGNKYENPIIYDNGNIRSNHENIIKFNKNSNYIKKGSYVEEILTPVKVKIVKKNNNNDNST